MRSGIGRGGSAREQRRRHLILLAIGLLILLGMSPILGHHAAARMDRLVLGADHLGALCLIALHSLLRPVHDLFHLLLAVGLGYAVWDRVQASRLLSRTLAPLAWARPAPGGAIEAAARAAGVDAARIRVAAGLPIPAFTAGWLHPRIYLAQELGDRLPAAELTAVIAHEGAHAARRDPLCLSTLRFVGHALFWIPVLQRLAEDCADEAEIRADAAASRGQPLAVASAILRLAEWSPPLAKRVGTGFHTPHLLVRRVRRLAGEEAPPRTHVTRRSVLAAAGTLGLVWLTGIVMAHPLPDAMPGHGSHCDHPDRGALSHLACARPLLAPATGPCPHAPRT